MVGILNSTEKTVEIYSLDFQTDPIYYFKNNTLKKQIAQSTYTNLRYENLALDENLSEEAKFLLENICRLYQDVFHFPGDKLSFTSIA